MLIDRIETLELHNDGEIDVERGIPILRAGCPVCGNWEKRVEHVMMTYWETMKMFGDGKHKGCDK